MSVGQDSDDAFLLELQVKQQWAAAHDYAEHREEVDEHIWEE